jgi:hypothetical protein
VEEEDDDEVRERASASSSRMVVEWRVIVCGGVWTSGMQGKMAALRPDKRGVCQTARALRTMRERGRGRERRGV